ncbi:unnamed protein product [Rotaria magnacalcarata]|uniref:Reverse transcriptase domain-containing protein n=1 Tax=Rotaria magnacalcarata TaxID=392030 RepID=A0A816W017_9BILA|nr:unnamed protein product [Rotaria magnacalcarata]
MELQEILEDVPKKDAILIIGDWNAKVGDTEALGIVGKYDLGKQNEAGEKLNQFCQENSLVITKTWFQQPKRRLYTWTSPNGRHRNQIDYMLCNRRWKSSITSVKTRPGADCGTDHELLLVNFKIKWKGYNTTSKAIKPNLQNIPYSYNVEVKNRFAELELVNREPEELWQEIHQIIYEEAKRNIPTITTKKKKTWISENTLRIAKERREAKIDGNKQLFSTLNAEFQREELKDDSIKVLTTLCQQIWKTKQWPSDWKKSIFIPIPKNGTVKDCSNYRTIALISHASKIMLKIIQRRLQTFLERELPDTQAGFRKGRGTRDQIANLRWIIEKAREHQKNFYLCFLDYSKAFDCVDHTKLWSVLTKMGIPTHLIVLIKNLYSNPQATVKTEYGNTNWFNIGKGVRQGCILSPYLFNLYAEYIMRKVDIDETTAGIKIGGRNINNLRYADDTTLLTENASDLKRLLTKLKAESAAAGLRLNMKKTFVMTNGPTEEFNIDNEQIKIHRNKKETASRQKSNGKPRQANQKQRHQHGNKDSNDQDDGLPNNNIWL